MGIDMLKDWVRDILVCPRDYHKLTQQKDTLICSLGHIYPIIEGIPIMLLDDKTPTQAQVFNATLKATRLCEIPSESNQQQDSIQSSLNNLDPFVNEVISATCGIMYKSLIGKLTRYPIPNLPLPKEKGKYLLDLGCNWGRWCINAAKLGYTVVGIDPNLDAIRAARRVAKQLNVSINYLVADARYLPFSQNTFDVIFSYSVLQHFDKDDTKLCLSKISRALKARGIALIQLPNTYGPRNLYNQLKNKFKKPEILMCDTGDHRRF